MTEKSFCWDSIATGDAVQAPYDETEWALWWSSILVMDKTKQCVLPTLNPLYSGNLEVTVTGTDVQMDKGIGMVDGTLYFNTAMITITIGAVGAGTNYYTVVLRKTYASKTVRVALLGPVDGGPRPAVTQNATVWEVEIAEVQQTNADVVTVTDLRNYIVRPNKQYVWIPVDDGYDITAAAQMFPVFGDYQFISTNTAKVYGHLACPADKAKGTACVIYSVMAVDPGTGNILELMDVYYGSPGENIQNHSGTPYAPGVVALSNVTANPIFWSLAHVHIASGANAFDVGDIARITWQRTGAGGTDTYNADTWPQGFYLEYQKI